MSRVSVKPTLASPPAAPAATLTRVPLPCALSPPEVLRALAEHEPLPFALTGHWADPPHPPHPRDPSHPHGGTAIIGANPLRVAPDTADPFAVLDAVPHVDGAPTPAGAHDAAVGGGWFGWLGYRLAARVEDVPLHGHRPVALPDFHLAYYDNVLRRDPAGRWWFEALVTDARRAALDRRLAHLTALLNRPVPPLREPHVSPLHLSAAAARRHVDAVAECRRRIAAGEIFQANICLRLQGETEATPVDLFAAALTRLDPPYAAMFSTPRGGIVSLSPELFLRRRGRHIVTGPIKGTIVRDDDPAVAAAALERLRGSVKDAAEHVMIVDLMRNDLGRVCRYGTVVAPRRPTPEPHPGLWHLVSHVHGQLRDEVSDRDVLRATFPPGSVTGAPKVQSLRVIAELESAGREVYTGAVGFAGPVAGLELNVAIRTLEVADGRVWLGAGGGIVADSEPQRELEEALAKARPIAAAVGTTVDVEHRAPVASAA
ncbi:MAG TPA: anthranilate synthase component I family protein [Solirubrobacteraceae bacterium]|nr:anthranilate synthase component I family protein [Solirubrobacteraceae bacterium]